MCPTSPAKPCATSDERAVLDDAGTDADGAGEVEQRGRVGRGAVVRLGVRRAVGVVADVHRTAAAEGALDLGRRPGCPSMSTLGAHATVRSSPRTRPGTATTAPDQLAVRVRADPSAPWRPPAPSSVAERTVRPDGPRLVSDHRAGEVEDHGRDVVDVELQAEGDVTGHRTRATGRAGRPRAPAAARLLGQRAVGLAGRRRSCRPWPWPGRCAGPARPARPARPVRSARSTAAVLRRRPTRCWLRRRRRSTTLVSRGRRRGARGPAGRGARPPARGRPAPRRRAAASEQVLPALALGERRHGQLGHPRASRAACTSGSARNARTFSRRIR